jgi:2'-5' RNA ligase
MQAVVSRLDDASTAWVEALWDLIGTEFGIRPNYVRPIPHFTYHVADHYDISRLRDALWHVSRDHAPFRVHAGGLGLFTGRKQVVHIPLVRNDRLNAVQHDLWRDLDGVGVNVVTHFHPDLWIPHVTLAYHGLTDELMPRVVRFLAERSFAWEIRVEALGVIEELGPNADVAHRFELTSPR